MPFYKTSFFNTLRASASVVNRPNFGNSSPAADLFRDGSSVVINGKSFYDLSCPSSEVTYHSQLGNNTTKEEALQSFFSNVLLKQLPNDYKENACWFLTKTFHQGGILFPAACSTALAMGEATAKGAVSEFYTTKKERPREDAIFITTTSRGFKIQNLHQAYMFKSSDEPGEVQGTLVASEVILDIDFTKLSSQKFMMLRAKIDECIKQVESSPYEQRRKLSSLREELGQELSSKIIRIEKNKIQTDNPQLSNALLKKSFLNTIIDFIKSLFGVQMNKVSSICQSGDDVFDAAIRQKEQSSLHSMELQRSEVSKSSSGLGFLKDGSVESIQTVSAISTTALPTSSVIEEDEMDSCTLSASFRTS